MSAIYDNSERLVAAVLKKQQLWELCHDHSRSPSVLSESSYFGFSFKLRSPLHHLASGFVRLGSPSTSNRASRKLVLVSDFSPAINLKNVSVASAKFLGRGTFGAAYVVVLDNGVRIVVKRLKSTSISKENLKRVLFNVEYLHQVNVVPLKACYSSGDERLLLYDYYSTGSVYALLYDVLGSESETNGETARTRAYVSWETRLKIAIGAAKGISEIHTQKHGTLVHGNIKATNIFLNSYECGCVSDLGITNMIKTKFVPGSYCYAPEVKNTKNVSQASDVYSFGILLLELLTRKPTIRVPGGPESVDLVKLINSVESQERVAELYDVDLLKRSTIREDMNKMLEIGIKCVQKSVKKRPKMSEVVKMLEYISRFHPISNAIQVAKPVFMEDAKSTFDPEDMVRTSADPTCDPRDIVRASVEMLGRGTFGTSYKARLRNGETIVAKRLSDVTVTFEDLQQHMQVTERMWHKNISRVRGYYFSNDEKLLVYDYHNQDSLSALLHGKSGSGLAPLNLETRLKIAVSAARGIDYIHKQDRGQLVPGNIKSSNIFLDEQNESIISDTGLEKLTNPSRLSHKLTRAYRAPEVKNTSNVSQASDVYSFGVVLLELLCRKPSQFTEDDGVTSLVEWIQSFDRDERTAEVLDGFLMYKNEETVLQLFQKAMYCVSVDPERRPRMYEVVMMLEEISGGSKSTNEPSIELEDLLETLLPTLAP